MRQEKDFSGIYKRQKKFFTIDYSINKKKEGAGFSRSLFLLKASIESKFLFYDGNRCLRCLFAPYQLGSGNFCRRLLLFTFQH